MHYSPLPTSLLPSSLRASLVIKFYFFAKGSQILWRHIKPWLICFLTSSLLFYHFEVISSPFFKLILERNQVINIKSICAKKSPNLVHIYWYQSRNRITEIYVEIYAQMNTRFLNFNSVWASNVTPGCYTRNWRMSLAYYKRHLGCLNLVHFFLLARSQLLETTTTL